MEQIAMPYDAREPLKPVVVLPVHLMDRDHLVRSPERLLVLAVLEDAVTTVLQNTRAHRGRPMRELREACRWFSDDSRDWAFSFLNLCDWLGLDASAIHRSLGLLLDHDEPPRSCGATRLPGSRGPAEHATY